MLFDTDIVVWVLRGKPKAARLVDRTGARAISIITYMELLQGARNTGETKTIRTFLNALAFQVIPLSENIGHRAAIYMEEYGPATGICLADALIAATAVEHDQTLCTANRKHYRAVKDLAIKAFRP